MARILYGVLSIGFGHAIRSRVIIDHLRKEGHEVMIVTSHDSNKYFSKYYKEVYNIEGLELVFKKNAILNIRTLLKNLRKASKKTYDRLLRAKKAIADFNPEVVISDMETFSSYIAKEGKLPLISIDNQHYLVYGDYTFPEKYRLSYLKALMIIRGIMFDADYYITMCLPGHKIKNVPNVFATMPVVREDIMKARPKKQEYIFVYQSTKSYGGLIEILKRINYKFIVYGFGVEKRVGNLVFKKFNDGRDFMNDLTNCKAVITNGGFTLISECIYLEKPMLVVPIRKHFEQVMNALYVKNNNFGEFYSDLDENHVVDFIMSLKKYGFSNVKKWNNKDTFGLLDMLIRKETR